MSLGRLQSEASYCQMGLAARFFMVDVKSNTRLEEELPGSSRPTKRRIVGDRRQVYQADVAEFRLSASLRLLDDLC